MKKDMGITIGWVMVGAIGGSLFIKPLFGPALTELDQMIGICTAAICFSIGALGDDQK